MRHGRNASYGSLGGMNGLTTDDADGTDRCTRTHGRGQEAGVRRQGAVGLEAGASSYGGLSPNASVPTGRHASNEFLAAELGRGAPLCFIAPTHIMVRCGDTLPRGQATDATL